jgi:hypothetical protein
MSDFESVRPVARVARIGRPPDPWAWPPWEAQHSDNTFGNRWDDPEGTYRVVYACGQLEGAYVEVLSRFRPDPAVVAELAEITGPSEEYESRLGDNYQNWAIFERPGKDPITEPVVRPVLRDDPALHAALAVLGLNLGPR